MFIFFSLQIVKLREMFPHGNGFVLVFDYMLSDLSEVIRSSMKPLTEAQVKSYMLMLLKGVEFMHGNNIMHRVCLYLQTHRICFKNLGFCIQQYIHGLGVVKYHALLQVFGVLMQSAMQLHST